MDAKALRSLSYGLYVIGVKNGEGYGGCVVDSLAQLSSGENPVVVVAVMKENYTNELIKKYGEFTLSVLSEAVDPLAVAIFGFQSARDADKWSAVAHELRDGLPVLDGGVAYLRLKVTETKELATHTAFFCEVPDAWKGETAAKPLIYADYQAEMKDLSKAAFADFAAGKAADKPKKWVCTVCGHVYDGETPFEELPDTWVCPICFAGKDKFAAQ
jgi:flavin reductase (DIM6/NTAB) family NADH-FMN oxidoreductase RutF/rubredoxin